MDSRFVGDNVNEDYIGFGDFIVEDYKTIQVPEYDIQLCKLTEERVAELHAIEDFTLKRSILGVDEISFRVDKYIYTSNGEKRPNPVYDLIEGNMLVLLNQMQYFILSRPKIVAQGREMPYKTIQGYSREYELSQKLIDGFQGMSRMVYDPTNSVDEEGIERGFLNYVENNTSWTVGYYNKDINKKHRALSLSTNILRATDEVQKTFGCIFRYDTINKVIDVFDPMQLGVNQGIYISDENYINELSQEIEDENIVTRLYLYGADDISVSSLTPTGQPFIQDFTYYKKPKFMTEGLIKGLNRFESNLNNESNKEVFQKILEDEKEYTEKHTLYSTELKEEQKKLNLLQHEWDLLVAEDKGLTSINREIKAQERVVASKKADIARAETQLQGIARRKKELVAFFDLNRYLSKEEQKELDFFIKEEKYFDSNYTRDNVEDLLEDGIEMLSKLSRPKLTFKVSVDDFLSMAEGRFMWHRFGLGDIINLEHKEIGFDYEVRLIGYTHIPGDFSLELTFSSVHSVYDGAIYLEEILEEAIDVSNTVDFNKFKWDKGEDVQNDFSDYINHNLDLSNQALAKAEGQKPMLDDRGLWLYKENPDGSASPEQIRAINNVIAITKDNWNTVEWALTPNGIMAKQLIGDIILGTDLKIVSNSGIVEILNNLITIRDDRGRLRVALGNYSNGKYGLQIKDKEGRNTIIDEDGMLQVWQEGRTDNTDEYNPLEVSLFIPQNARHIYNVNLRVEPSEFRAYSGITEAQERTEFTSEDGGAIVRTEDDYFGEGVGNSQIELTATDDKVTVVETTDVVDYDMSLRDIRTDNDELYYGTHNHGIQSGDGVKVRRNTGSGWVDATAWFRESGAHHHGGHTHRINLPRHSHTIDMPRHGHSITLPDHVHKIVLEEHSHPINPEIIKSRSTPRYRVRVNGSYVSSWTWGRDNNINITGYVTRGWNSIKIETDRIGRIDATVFCQCLLNFDGLG